MAIIRNGKVYRNIQEQVLKNTEDIDDLNSRVPYEDHFYTEDETDALLAKKQNTLVSSGDNQNIKTINGESILGQGNITTLPKHIYKVWFVEESNGLKYIGEVIFSSEIDVSSSSLSASQFYQNFGYLYIRGIGSAMNTSNEVVRNGFIWETFSDNIRILFNYYDSVEGDWVDDEITLGSIYLEKLI